MTGYVIRFFILYAISFAINITTPQHNGAKHSE